MTTINLSNLNKDLSKLSDKELDTLLNAIYVTTAERDNEFNTYLSKALDERDDVL